MTRYGLHMNNGSTFIAIHTMALDLEGFRDWLMEYAGERAVPFKIITLFGGRTVLINVNNISYITKEE